MTATKTKSIGILISIGITIALLLKLFSNTNETTQIIDLTNKEHVKAILSNSNQEYEWISNNLMNTIGDVKFNPQGLDLKIETGKTKLYYRAIPLISKYQEPPVWNSALNLTALYSMFKSEYNNEVLFNADPFEEFVFGVHSSVLDNNLTTNDIVCILLVKIVITNRKDKYMVYQSGTIASYSIKIYYSDLQKTITDKYVNQLLNSKLKYNNLN